MVAGGGVNVTRPILRWHGGKFVMAQRIISHFPKHRVYVEPFGGAASVLLCKPRAYAEIYNDLDGEVVNVFRVARDKGDELRRVLMLTPFSRDEFEVSYESSDDPVEWARRTIVRSFMGFGSNAHNQATGFRANSNRSGTPPARDWMNYPDALAAVIDRLRGVTIENRDAMKVMAQHDSAATLHYVDPPYVLSSRSDERPDYRHELTDDQHVELAKALRGLAGMVVLSGYRCALYDELFGDWRRIDFAARSDGAKERVESLWFSQNVCVPQGDLLGGEAHHA